MNRELENIKARMIEAGIPEKEVDALVEPLAKELERRVCGLVWKHEGATTKLVEDMEGKLPVLTPVKDKNIVQDETGINHILIEGENLLTLMAMQYTHIDENRKGLVDVIYIDPPYNTGSVTFEYNDKFEKSEWLSMMNVRLRLAKNLLSDDGVLMMSIDELFVSLLKMLCLDIFGEPSSVLMVESSVIAGPRRVPAMQGSVVKNAEYVLIYKKNGDTKVMKNLMYDPIIGFDKHYSKYYDEKEGRVRQFIDVIKEETNIAKEFAKYDMEVTLDNLGKIIVLSDLVKKWLYSDEIASHLYRKGERENLDEIFDVKNMMHRVGNKWYISTAEGTFNVFRYIDRIGRCNDYFNSFGERTVRGNLWKGFSSDGGNLDKEGGVSFKNGKKPKRLIKQLIHAVCDKCDAVILDFFAGSGTTGQAVVELNEELGGKRQFILCTNNELGKETKKKAKKNGLKEGTPEYEDYGVCHAVTYPRLHNVFAEHKNDNLYYYQISDSIKESPIQKITRDALAKQAVFYIALKENILNVDEHKDYHILSNSDTEVLVVIDTDIDYTEVHDKIASQVLSKANRKIYCSLKRRTIRDGIEYIPYPEEVLDVLKSVKKRVKKESKR